MISLFLDQMHIYRSITIIRFINLALFDKTSFQCIFENYLNFDNLTGKRGLLLHQYPLVSAGES